MEKPLSPASEQILEEAERKARYYQHNFVGVEHLLLGILYISGNRAAEIIRAHNITLKLMRTTIELQIGMGPVPLKREVEIPRTPSLSKILVLAEKEAAVQDSPQVLPEHLLLGILRNGDGLVCQTLISFGFDYWQVRDKVYSAPVPKS